MLCLFDCCIVDRWWVGGSLFWMGVMVYFFDYIGCDRVCWCSYWIVDRCVNGVLVIVIDSVVILMLFSYSMSGMWDVGSGSEVCVVILNSSVGVVILLMLLFS